MAHQATSRRRSPSLFCPPYRWGLGSAKNRMYPGLESAACGCSPAAWRPLEDRLFRRWVGPRVARCSALLFLRRACDDQLFLHFCIACLLIPMPTAALANLLPTVACCACLYCSLCLWLRSALLYVLLSTPMAVLGARNTGSLWLNFALASAVTGSHSHIYWLPTVAHQGSLIVDTLLASSA